MTHQPYLKRVLLRHLQDVIRGLHTVDHFLRCPPAANEQPRLSLVLSLVLISGLAYGMGMGSYAALTQDRSWGEQWPQMLYSGVKVPLMIGTTLLVSLPSFYVLNSLFGLRRDLGTAVRAVVSAQAGLTLVLASLLPVALLFGFSVAHARTGYPANVVFHGVMFAMASLSSQLLLRRYYQPLFQRDRRHRFMFWCWIVIYAFVGIQAAYVLRPFIGNPTQPPTFLREDPLQNAYVEVARLIRIVWDGL